IKTLRDAKTLRINRLVANSQLLTMNRLVGPPGPKEGRHRHAATPETTRRVVLEADGGGPGGRQASDLGQEVPVIHQDRERADLVDAARRTEPLLNGRAGQPRVGGGDDEVGVVAPRVKQAGVLLPRVGPDPASA